MSKPFIELSVHSYNSAFLGRSKIFDSCDVSMHTSKYVDTSFRILICEIFKITG